MIVLLSCGYDKTKTPGPAKELYKGMMFRRCLRFARVIAPEGRIFVVSAKHGILGLNDFVAPYDLRMGDPGSIDTSILRSQAEKRGLLSESTGSVISFLSKDYFVLAQQVWPCAIDAFDGKPHKGFGARSGYLAKWRQACSASRNNSSSRPRTN